MPDPVELILEFETTANVDRAWEVFADSNRMNKAAGLNYEFHEEPQEDGTTKRFGRFDGPGGERKWEEVGLWFNKPQTVQNERAYESGPMKRAFTELEIFDKGDVTGVRWTAKLDPADEEHRPIVEQYCQGMLRPLLTGVFERAKVVAESDDPWAVLEPVPPVLSPEDLKWLDEAITSIEPPEIGKAIADIVKFAPVSQQARILPLRVAQRAGINEDEAVLGFLDAVREGILEMTWELLCPSCMGSKANPDTLEAKLGEKHCPSCNILYDGGFPDSVNVTFKTCPTLRKVETQVACVLSPSWTPHVKLRQELQPRVRTTIAVDVQEGGYLLDMAPHLGAAGIEVREGVDRHDITLNVTVRGVRPKSFEVGPGPLNIHLTSRTRGPIEVTLKERYRPDDALTGGRLMSIRGVKAHLPEGALAPHLDTTIVRSAVVAIDIPSGEGELAAIIAQDLTEEGRRVLYVGDSSIITTWDDVGDALAVAESLAGEPALAVGIAVGAVTEMRDENDCVPAGPVVDAACQIMREVSGGHVGIESDSLHDHSLEEALKELGEAAHLGDAAKHYTLLHFASAKQRLEERMAELREKHKDEEPHIGGYKVIGEIGRGGMGAVYEVEDTETGDRLVIKTLLPELASDARFVQRFYNEARLSLDLDHPHIVAVSDYGEDDTGVLYIVMEKLNGKELMEVLAEEGSIDQDRATHIANGCLGALQYAHAKGIVHRDLKPENIFLVYDDEGNEDVRVIDFGIAHPMDEECEFAKNGILVGTLNYVSPEQANLEALDGRSDLYSLALVLWQSVKGEAPFSNKNPYMLVMARMDGPAPRIDDGVFADVLERATAVKPAGRYTDADSMAAALRGEAQPLLQPEPETDLEPDGANQADDEDTDDAVTDPGGAVPEAAVRESLPPPMPEAAPAPQATAEQVAAAAPAAAQSSKLPMIIGAVVVVGVIGAIIAAGVAFTMM